MENNDGLVQNSIAVLNQTVIVFHAQRSFLFLRFFFGA